MPQFIYTMKGLGKVYPPDSQVLKDIWLSFFPGAKIGVLGLNGSGKSTLLKIMAGARSRLRGGGVSRRRDLRRLSLAGAAARSHQNRAGHRRRRRGRSPRAAAALRRDQREVCARTCRRKRWTRCSRNRRACRIASTPPARGSSTPSSSWRWTRCGCRQPDVEVKTLSGGERRRVALCRLLLQCARSAAARRADQPSRRRSVAWLERFLKDYPGTVVAVTHDRYFLDNVAGWILELDRGSGIPWEGNYSSWLEQKQKRLSSRRRASRSASGRWRASSNGCGWRLARGRRKARRV